MKVELNFLEKFNLAKICLEVFMAFVRSGWVNVSTAYEGAMRNVGNSGYGWSRTASGTPSYPYRLSFNPTNVYPSDNYDRYPSFPLRCLYPGSA